MLMNEQEAPKRSGFNYKFSIWAILVAAVGVYVAFVLYQTVYFNYKTNQQIKDLEAQQVKLREDKDRLGALVAYYKTDTFQELEARKKLGLKMPGEKVVKVEVEKSSETNELKKSGPEEKQTKPNWQLWIDYFIE